MIAVTSSEADVLTGLGARLRRRRLLAGEPQARAASRIGVSVPTYRKLEQGDPAVQIGIWVRAIGLYGTLSDFDLLLPESLFDTELSRQRAPRRQP
jgi:transcriptional regulator with XRE-family HTH domain